MASKFISKNKNHLIFGLLVLVFIIPLWYFKKDFIRLDFSVILGLIFSPFIFRRIGEIENIRYFLGAIFLACLLCFHQSSSAYIFLFAFSILFLFETFIGRSNNLPLFLFVVISPLFRLLTDIWSFPIRLKLSELAGNGLAFFGWNTKVVGNIIYLNEIPFSVDPECMGLKMIGTSLLIGLMVLAHFEREREYNFRIFEVGFWLFIVGLLAILANFTRLLVLVIFRIMPEHPLHEVLGIVSLISYVIVPFYFLIKRVSADRKPTFFTKNNTQSIHRKWIFISILYFFLLYHGNKFLMKPSSANVDFEEIELPNFKKSITENGILKLENEQVLIYVKAPVRPFQGSHDPRICWKGSGYDFSNIEVKNIGGIDIYTAHLTQEAEVIYTAWWYDNGVQRTIGEWDWRWQTFKGMKGFRLINVSSVDETILEEEVSNFLKIRN